MSTTLSRYPKYKDPDVRWIGKVPEHWDVRKLKQVVSIAASNVSKESVDGESKVLLCNYTDVYYNSEITRSLKFMQATAPPEQAKRFQLKKGDVLITKDSETPDDIGVPAVVTEELEGVLCGYHLALLRPKKMTNGIYLRYALESSPCREHFHMSANGITRYGLSLSDIGTATILSPPLEEQEAIGRFIRHLDLRVNRLLKTKRRLIELLNEQKQAIIHRAVTRGLDPAVRLKASGVEWLGEVPEHWGVRKITHLFNIIGSGTTPSTSDRSYYDGGNVPWVVTGNLKNRELHATSKYVTKKALEDYSTLKMFPANSVIVALYGATIGKVGLLRIAACVNQACCVLADSKLLLPEYTTQLFVAFREEIVRLGVGGGQPNISQDIIRQLRFPVPPESEQKSILSMLAKETQPLDLAVSKAIAEIDFIREYRTRLVSDVVTGQLDVRGLDLPEAEEEAASLDDEGEDGDELPGEDGDGDE